MTGRVIAAISLVLVLAGCGQKGPLYLPDPTPEPASEPAREAAADSGAEQHQDSGDAPSD